MKTFKCRCGKWLLTGRKPWQERGYNKAHTEAACGRYLRFEIAGVNAWQILAPLPAGAHPFEVVWTGGSSTQGVFSIEPTEEPNGTSEIPV